LNEEFILKQKMWLQQLYDSNTYPMDISYNFEGRIGKWIPYDHAFRFPVDYRNVLPNEIVFDLDDTNWKHVLSHAINIINVLKIHKIPYYVFRTGGKGLHISVFYKFSEHNFSLAKKAANMGMLPKDFRLFLWNWILDLAQIDRKVRKQGQIVDKSKVSWNDAGRGSLIRVTGGKKVKYDPMIKYEQLLGYKTLVTEDLTMDTAKTYCKTEANIIYPDDVIQYWIPDERIINECFNQFIEIKSTDYTALSENTYTGKFLQTPCVKKILQGLDIGIRSEGAKILGFALLKDNIDMDKCKQILVEYKNKCRTLPNEPFSDTEAFNWIQWAKGHDSIFWTCSFCKQLDLCNPNECNLFKEKNEDVMKLYNDPHILIKVREMLDEEITNEYQTKLLVFMILLSHIDPELAQWATVSGESSGGKTYIVLRVLDYMPSERIKMASRRTATSLEHGEQDLRQKIMVDLEARGGQDAQASYLTLNSEGKLILETTVKDPATGNFETITKEVQGPPSYITCNASIDIHPEMATRTWTFGVDTSREQSKRIVDDGLDKESNLDFLKEDSRLKNKKTIQDLIRTIKPYKVWIPFASFFKGRLNIDSVRVRRDKDKFMSLIKISALLHQSNRQVVRVLKGDEEVEMLIATVDDLFIALELTEKAFESTRLGVKEPALKTLALIKEVTTSTGDGMTCKNISEMADCENSQDSVYRHCKELYAAGLVSEEPSKRGRSLKYKYAQKTNSEFLVKRNTRKKTDPDNIGPNTIKEARETLSSHTRLNGTKKIEVKILHDVYTPIPIQRNTSKLSLISILSELKYKYDIEIDDSLLDTKGVTNTRIQIASEQSEMVSNSIENTDNSKQSNVYPDLIDKKKVKVTECVKALIEYIDKRNDGDLLSDEELQKVIGNKVDNVESMCKDLYNYDSKRFYFSPTGFGVYRR